MPEKPLPIGEAGRNVAANVERLRREQHLSLRALSRRLGEAGRPILPIGLSRLSNLQRRVDTDDLVALAAVLGVTTDVLLAPPADAPQDLAPDHAVLAAAAGLAARLAALITDPADRKAAAAAVRALRRVQLEMEELLDVAPEEE